MKNYIYLTADTNDADFINSLKEISDEDLIEFKKILEVLKVKNRPRFSNEKDWKRFGDINWQRNEYVMDEYNCPEYEYKDNLTLKQIEFFDSFVPSGPEGSGGSQSVDFIKVLKFVEEEKLL